MEASFLKKVEHQNVEFQIQQLKELDLKFKLQTLQLKQNCSVNNRITFNMKNSVANGIVLRLVL